MTRSQSHYLNMLRGFAALAVFAVHASLPAFTGAAWSLPDSLGHGAVIVFFVLSGFVISHVARTRERQWPDYAVSRAVRVYSVAIPALALTVAIDQFLRARGVAGWSREYQLEALHRYLPMFALFATDFWFLGEDALSNVPYWSLCYEVWYYVVFAALFYARGALRVALVLVVATLVGPRLWALFPVWLMGWAVLAGQERFAVSTGMARMLFAATAAAAVVFIWSGAYASVNQGADALSGGWIGMNMRKSARFLGDWLFGALVAMHFWSVRHAALDFGRAARWIVLAASVSFTLYLAHYPLLGLWRHLLGPTPWLVVPAVLVSVVALGLLTERQKHRFRGWAGRPVPVAR